MTYTVAGHREYPCGPHYGRDKKEIKNRVRFSPHPGIYDKQCPTCGRPWKVVIQIPNSWFTNAILVAKWYDPSDPELYQVKIIGDGSKFSEGIRMMDGDGPEWLSETYRTRAVVDWSRTIRP